MRNEGKERRDDASKWCTQQSDTFATPERRKFRRIHGLQLPLHPQQVTGWIVILIIATNTFAVLTPRLETNLRPVVTTVIAAIFLTHLSSHLVVLLMDPADPRVRSQPTNKVLPEFDRGKHSHVIENGRCHLCNITTDSRKTKHCSICNKCIVRFDHHCKWLNNCIGARNYTAFLVCLISAILANLFVAGLSATELSLSLISHRSSDYHGGNETATSAFIAPISGTPTIIAVVAIGTLSGVAAILLLHLCFFHGYIAYLGLTTYEYVRKKREKHSIAAAMAIAAVATATATTATTATDIGIVDRSARDAIGDRSTTESRTTARHESLEFASARCCVLSSPRKSTSSSLYTPRGSVKRRTVFEGESRPASIRRFLCQKGERSVVGASRSNETSTTNRELSSTISRRNSILPTDASTSPPSSGSCANALCCSTLHRLTGSTARPSEGGDRNSIEVSTNASARVESMGKFVRTYSRNGNIGRSSERDPTQANTGGSTMPTADSNLAEEAAPVAAPLPNRFDKTLGPPSKLPPLHCPSAAKLNGHAYGDAVATRESLFVERSARTRATIKTKSHALQSTKLSPILESEVSVPGTPTSPRIRRCVSSATEL